MRKENGAIRVIPGTHKKTGWPDEYIDIHVPHPDEVQVEVPAGSFIVMNAHTWHAGALNPTGGRRRTLYIDYRNRRLPQLLNQKKYLRPETLAKLSDLERYLLGVRDSDPAQAEDSLGPGAAYRAWLAKVKTTA
jgi:ectoine hydroxylase-related dioxygenase (phytanoyl-CoA dioxygenase family)